MLLEEQDYFRQKMQDEYGPGWEEIVEHYKQKVTPRSRHKYEDYKGDWSVDPTRFRTDNPLSLLSSREDIDAVLRDPSLRTKQDWIDELDHFAPNRLKESRPPMEMNTSGVPVDYYGPSQFQNRISPLPHQLEGPERDRRTWEDRDWTPAYDPNQELYDPNYYGTPGQMGQMGAPPPGIIPSSVTGRHTSPDAPYSVSGMSAMSGGEMPGLLGPDDQISQAFPGPEPEGDLMEQALKNHSAGPLAGPLAETSPGEGGKWESDPRWKNALAKYMMQIGNNYSQTDPFYLD
jgi:hypothetical protein